MRTVGALADGDEAKTAGVEVVDEVAEEARPTLRSLNEEPYPSVRWRPEQPLEAPSPVPVNSERLVERVKVVTRIKLSEKESGIGKGRGCLIHQEKWKAGIVSVARVKEGGADGEAVVSSFRCYRTILGPEQRQEEAFREVVGPSMLEAFLAGTDCAVLAYGQTGSGKTFTMFGSEECLTPNNSSSNGRKGPSKVGDDRLGVIPRAAMAILSALPAGASLELSCVEVYCEEVYDLLDGRKPVKLVTLHDTSAADGEVDTAKTTTKKHENPKSRIHIGNDISIRAARGGGTTTARRRRANAKGESSELSRGGNKTFTASGQETFQLRSDDDILSALRRVDSARQKCSHAMNAYSSRSHCVVLVTMRRGVGSCRHETSMSPPMTGGTTFAFVDLAGSERLKKSHSEGQHRREAVTVNNSLTTLGRCVRSLAASTDGAGSNPTSGDFLPTRDSALTMLLSKALKDGRCCLVVTVSPEARHVDETLCSLTFGSRVSTMQTNVTAPSLRVSSAKTLGDDYDGADAVPADDGARVARRRTRKVARGKPTRRLK